MQSQSNDVSLAGLSVERSDSAIFSEQTCEVQSMVTVLRNIDMQPLSSVRIFESPYHLFDSLSNVSEN